ncbi:high mobility group B protein 15-like [Zingiber officinale]|uniref:high mobility group B protein 15-like n=1 Tax=Zingiber officinale TaxID=94328 RepID=UPI001C4C5B4B|nr:high mobility group B protein 15-like [Zingiber officinale]
MFVHLFSREPVGASKSPRSFTTPQYAFTVKESMKVRMEENERGGEVAEKGKYDLETVMVDHHYPEPLAKYEDVIADPKLFTETLEDFHSRLGTKLRVPTVGGKELDLHCLFVEVTSRGGIEKVIEDRKLKEVTSAFTFSSTTTSASYLVRKNYMSLLRNYEQVYFFRSSASMNMSSATSGLTERSLEEIEPSSETQAISQKRRRKNRLASSSPYQKVVGVIDGKFEQGYFVTVTIGAEKLKGVLYHIPRQTDMQLTKHAEVVDNSNLESRNGGRARKKKLSKSSPNHPKPKPKPNKSGYPLFFAEQQAKLKPLYPRKGREINKMIRDLWSKLPESEKDVYQDMQSYRTEIANREKLKSSQIIDAASMAHSPAEPKILQDAGQKIPNKEDNLILSNENDSSSETRDSAGKFSEDDSDIEAYPEFGGTPITSRYQMRK